MNLKPFIIQSTMANKPKRFCSAYPCNNLVAPGERFQNCPEHQPKAAERERNPFYHTQAWRRYSEWYRSKYPLCENCLKHGLAVPVDVVDHIAELKDGGAKFSEDNTQSLCHACHNAKSRKERKKRGPKVYSY